jgi:hypothetical protein
MAHFGTGILALAVVSVSLQAMRKACIAQLLIARLLFPALMIPQLVYGVLKTDNALQYLKATTDQSILWFSMGVFSLLGVPTALSVSGTWHQGITSFIIFSFARTFQTKI